ncbi:Kinesin-like protein [Aphelenchoides bicaudatus]|nr:Kinesin-like protein [Aphelenchoides bicaudatus]
MAKQIVASETPSTTDSGTGDSLLAPPQTTESDPTEERKHKYPVRSRHALHNNTQQQLTVAVRIRPINEAEIQRRGFDCAFPLDQQKVLLVDPEKFENNILRQNRQHERQFLFDRVFRPGSTHSEVHDSTTAPLVDFVLSGFNATVFAYGPTGSGKTFYNGRHGRKTRLDDA